MTLVDDHDQVRKGRPSRGSAATAGFRDLAFNVVAAQLTTMGIPCIYYGTEQGFDSGGRPSGSDLVLRESMFGGRFGGKCTQDRHFFDEDADSLQGTRGPDRSAQEAAAAAAWPANAARNLRRRCRLRRAHRLIGERMRSLVCLVAAFRRSGGARCFEHRPRGSQ